MRIVVLPGDGIGPEIAGATTNVLRAASARFQLDVKIEQHPVGHESLQQFGSTVQSGLLQIVRAAETEVHLQKDWDAFVRAKPFWLREQVFAR